MIQGLSKLAIRNTLRRGKKSWITVIGVFIGIAAVVSLVSLGQGLEIAITQEFEELGSNQVLITGNIDDSDLETIERIRGVDKTAGAYTVSRTVSFRGEEQRLNVLGADLNNFNTFFTGLPFTLEDGRQLRGPDRTSTMITGGMSDLFERDIDINDQAQLEGESYRVQGVYSSGNPEFQNSMIIEIDQLRDLEDADDDLTQIVAIIQPGFTQEEVRQNLEEDLRHDRGLQEGEEDFDVTIPQDILDTLTSILGVVQGIVVGLASIALLVGGIGIMNTMYMAINERTQEIGVLKAIGASKRDIRILFLLEAGLIGLIGGIIGVIIGIGISEIAVYLTTEFSDVMITRGYDLPLIFGALTFSTVLGILSGYLPSRRASNLKPAEALRYE